MDHLNANHIYHHGHGYGPVADPYTGVPPGHYDAAPSTRDFDSTTQWVNTLEGPSAASSKRGQEGPQPAFTHDSNRELKGVRVSSHRSEAASGALTKPLWRIWMLEMLCVLLSLLAFITIVVTLFKCDRQKLPDWPLKISLNTFLAFFTTLSKAAFMVPVSIAISQAQWSWFLDERPLHDFHVIDQASRGPWGSIVLLTRIRTKHIVVIGAFITIISVVTSPITQLAISYPVREVVAAELAEVPAVRTVMSPRDEVTFATRTAMLEAITPDGKQSRRVRMAPTGATCPTGNCTFDVFHSLGVCVEMVDISSAIVVQSWPGPEPGEEAVVKNNGSVVMMGDPFYPRRTIWNASLPGTHVDLVHQSRMAAVSDMLVGNQTVGFADNPTLMATRIASFVELYTVPIPQDDENMRQLTDMSNGSNIASATHQFRHEALEFLFHLCVQTYNTTIRNGIHDNQLIATTSQPTPEDSDFFLNMNCSSKVGVPTGCRHSPSSKWNITLHLESPPNSSIPSGSFSANYRAMEFIAGEMKTYMMGSGRETYYERWDSPSRGVVTRSDFIKTIMQMVLYTETTIINTTARIDTMTYLFKNIATSISYRLRTTDQELQLSSDAFNVTGQAWKQESYVHITWPWLTFLAVELLVASIFLVATIIGQVRMRKAARHEAGSDYSEMFFDYKDAAIAPLLALGQQCRSEAGGGLGPRGVMEKVAKSLRVKIDGNEVVVSRSEVWGV
ncbi:hypothetical protein QC761_610450 [Podospora bellae-mahoneyi]|uniref:Uncharacterized protein n=1 Tax=Podospora bellae-mahoneyi TaxID=2093777 RepID=A0ABR0FDQ0_9PEZI|nr:hypothetical protein QC761_610450 [Podospora bellae-mahoneyi]